MARSRSAVAVLSLLLSACAPPVSTSNAASAASEIAHVDATGMPVAAVAPADRFLAALAAHCGKAYVGKVIANEPTPATPDDFEGKALVMHVRGCKEPTRELRVPFHVGDDRSRTWVITRTEQGLRLKHDHRHADGSDDVLTMYGGDTGTPGTPTRQAFPVDAASIALFEREGSAASVTNTWAMEIQPGREFVYELSRPGGRLFRVAFDLATPVPTPPAPWGATD